MNKEMMQMAKAMKGRDPQQMVMALIQNSNAIDPEVSQLVQFAQTGDMNSLMNLATSMLARQGLDLNEELMSLMELVK